MSKPPLFVIAGVPEVLEGPHYKAMSQEDFSNKPAPQKITVSSIEELNKQLDEGLEDINSGNVVPAEAVNQRLHEKYGI